MTGVQSQAPLEARRRSGHHAVVVPPPTFESLPTPAQRALAAEAQSRSEAHDSALDFASAGLAVQGASGFPRGAASLDALPPGPATSLLTAKLPEGFGDLQELASSLGASMSVQSRRTLGMPPQSLRSSLGSSALGAPAIAALSSPTLVPSKSSSSGCLKPGVPWEASAGQVAPPTDTGPRRSIVSNPEDTPANAPVDAKQQPDGPVALRSSLDATVPTSEPSKFTFAKQLNLTSFVREADKPSPPIASGVVPSLGLGTSHSAIDAAYGPQSRKPNDKNAKGSVRHLSIKKQTSQRPDHGGPDKADEMASSIASDEFESLSNPGVDEELLHEILGEPPAGASISSVTYQQWAAKAARKADNPQKPTRRVIQPARPSDRKSSQSSASSAKVSNSGSTGSASSRKGTPSRDNVLEALALQAARDISST
eukprot:NODE_1480_length_1403_cov_12.727474_g1229_i0.p1 GENE.NODE_1480_length_1403_cov_12.727474_g1229_i0~~NODE_1480_length_1403_cov_12.727474_g1229_i0.p1  ORF type:complete len:426 (+),score=34.30 NODE_1480_length_1403_cov_12.727474_g1229_i0:22-1299(+)